MKNEEELRKEINTIIKKMETMIEENKSSKEIYEIKSKLDKLLNRYLEENK